MHQRLIDIPDRMETERLYLRPYRKGDGKWYFAMSQRNRAHLREYESGNVAMSIENEEEAEILMRDLAIDWEVRNCLFIGAFDRLKDEFIAQIYVGPVNWNLAEFEIGYFVDCQHEGKGYVTEAVLAVLDFLFTYLNAHRIRLQCDESNIRSCRLAERCGFIREGKFRENNINQDGSYTGTVFYGILRHEFKQ